VAHEQDAFADDVQHPIITRVRQLLCAARADPVATEDPLLLLPVHLFGVIPARGQRLLQACDGRRCIHGDARSAPSSYRSGASSTMGTSRRYSSLPGGASSSRPKRWPLCTACTIAPGASASPIRSTETIPAACSSSCRAIKAR